MLKKYIPNPTARIFINLFLGFLVYFLMISLLIYVEQDSNQSAITDYQNAIWYSVVTLTTVGYGDLFPATLYGRLIGYVFILMSLGIFGILIGQITTLMTTINENKRLGHNGTTFTGHAIIIGWNDFGRMVLEQLIGVGKNVAVVTNKKLDIENIHDKHGDKGVFPLYMDFDNHEGLHKANIEQSSIVFVNLDNDTEKLVYILNLRKRFPNLEYVVTLDNGDLKNTFISAGVTNTISKHEISSKLLASYMFEPDVASFSESVMSFAQSDTDYDMKQFLVTSSNPYVGKAYQDVFFELKKKYNSVILGITKRDKFGDKKLIKNPLGELKIAQGDYLIILLNGKAFRLLKKVFSVNEGYIRESDKKTSK
jgi:voltage-gated potassium channel